MRRARRRAIIGRRSFRDAGLSGEALFFELAVEDLRRAADLFAPIYERTGGVDGWVSLEVSPLLAYDAKATVSQATALHEKANRRNVLIKIPGTREGGPAIAGAICSGVPVNVTLLFARDHYLAAAEAYMRGLERRVEAGLSPDVRSVASLFISRWDKATMDKVPDKDRDKLDVAVGQQAYAAYRDVLESDRWQRLANYGAYPQRLLFASTGTKDPKASDVLYIGALAAPNTVNTMPEETLLAFGEHGRAGRGGNAKRLRDLPNGCCLGDNANAFAGGFRLWMQNEKSDARRNRTTHASADVALFSHQPYPPDSSSGGRN